MLYATTGICKREELYKTEETRQCTKCGEILPVECFYVRKDRPNEIVHVCKTCSAKRQREYNKNNPEKSKEIAARFRERHREELRIRNREYYQKYKDTERHKESVKRTKEKHKDKWLANDREKRRSFNEKWKHPCEKCGESRLYLIQFHHIDPATKSFNIGESATHRKQNELENEVKKCVCLCSNCHDEFHYFYGSRPDNPIDALEQYLDRKVVFNEKNE